MRGELFQAHIPTPEPPLPPGTDIPDPLPHPQPGVPGEITPTPADEPRPIDDPEPGPPMRDPPGPTPNPRRY